MDLEILKAQWEDLEDWKKLIIVLFISAILGYLVYMFILSGKIDEKKRLESELESKMIEFEVIKKNASPERRAELIQELESEKIETEHLKRKLEEVKAKFKPRDDINRTISFLTAVANKNGVVIENIKVISTEDVYLKYNPITDKVETIVENVKTNPKVKGIKPRLAPIKRNKNNNKNKNNNEATDMANQGGENRVHLKRFKYAVDIRGTTGGVLGVIKDIVRTKNFVNVEKVNLSKDKKKSGLVQSSLEIVSYTEGDNKLDKKKEILSAKQEVK